MSGLELGSGRLSRRALLRGAGVGAAALVGAGAVPAAAGAATTAGPLPQPTWSLQLARVWASDDTQRRLLGTFDATHTRFADGSVEVLLAPQDLARLQASGLRHVVLVPDVLARDVAAHRAAAGQASAAAGQPGQRSAYRTLEQVEADLRDLARRFPDRARLLVLSETTLEGREILGIEVARDVTRDDGRPVFYMDGGHHAREWPSVELAIMWAYDLLENDADPRIATVVEHVRSVVVPVVNPDGFAHSRSHPLSAAEAKLTFGTAGPVAGLTTLGPYWRKNRRSVTGPTVRREPIGLRDTPETPGAELPKPVDMDHYGVDSNRNYAYLWGDDIGGSGSLPADQNFRGDRPLSEPENRAVDALLAGRQVTGLVTHHTTGDLVLWPWGHTAGAAPDDEQLAGIGHWSAALNGYAGRKGVDLYATSGTLEDHAYAAYGTIAYTFEHGLEAFHPPYLAHIPQMYARNREALLLVCEETSLVPSLRPSRGPQPAASAATGFRSGALNHCLITGRLVDAAGEGVPGAVTLRRRAATPLWKDGDGRNPTKQRSVDHRVETRLATTPDGSFVLHCNPSTRPAALVRDPAAVEAWEVTAAPAGGGRGVLVEVVVRRGEVVDLGDLRTG